MKTPHKQTKTEAYPNINNLEREPKPKAAKKTNKSSITNYFYKGSEADLVVFVKSKEAVEHYLQESPRGNLADVVDVFGVYTNLNSGRGSEGELGEASKAQIENEFGPSKNREDVIDHILREGQFGGERDALKNKDRYRERF